MFYEGVIVPPSKLIVTKHFSPKFVFILGLNYEGGRSNQKSYFMRELIVPPSKLIVNNICPPQVCFNSGGVIIKGGGD